MNSGNATVPQTRIPPQAAARPKTGIRRVWVMIVLWYLVGALLQPAAAETTSDEPPCFSRIQGGRIKDIRIQGAFPLLNREILSAMSLYVGPVLNPDVLNEQKSRIEAYLVKEGFLQPKVTVEADPDPSDGNYVVRLILDKGRYQHLANLRFTGNRSFSALHLEMRMTTWKKSLLPGVTGRLIPVDIQKDIQNLTAFYRHNGYLDAAVSDHIQPLSEETGEADLEIRISEGLPYRFEWEGNHAFSDTLLKNDLVFFETGKITDIGIRRSIHKIQTRYQKAGYMTPQVHIKEIPATDGTPPAEKVFAVVISEGPQTRIDHVRIAGNQALSASDIQKQILSQPGGLFRSGPLVQETLDEDVQAISALYFSKGFRTAEIAPDVSLSADHTGADIRFDIQEGRQTRVSEIIFTGLHAVSEKAAMSAFSMKIGCPYFEDTLETDKVQLTEMISETGHPHVQIQTLVTFPVDPYEARIEYRIDEGIYVVMGDVKVSGNFTTRDRILKNEMEIRTGEPFSLKKLLKSQKNIRNMDIIRSVRFQACGLKEKAGRVDLLIDVEEAKPYVVDFGIGYETEKGAFIHPRAEDRNLMGANMKAWTEFEVSQIGYIGQIGLTEPRLFESRISADFLMYTEEISEFNQNFGVRILGTSLSLSRKWENKLSAAIAFNAEKREQYQNSDLYGPTYYSDNLIINELAPRSLMMATPKLQYDTRDSFVRPRSGIFAAASVDISKGLDSDLDHFIRYRLDTRYYYTPLSRLTFACSARWGDIEPMNTNGVVANDQLFFLGGSASVRGYDENMLRFDRNNNPVGGLSSASGTIEARIDLGHQIELCLFTDTGILSQYQVPDIGGGFRSSVGLGLRYLTPIGPVGLVYGFKLDREPGESPGRFHISIGYSF